MYLHPLFMRHSSINVERDSVTQDVFSYFRPTRSNRKQGSTSKLSISIQLASMSNPGPREGSLPDDDISGLPSRNRKTKEKCTYCRNQKQGVCQFRHTIKEYIKLTSYSVGSSMDHGLRNVTCASQRNCLARNPSWLPNEQVH